jgi:hypothetical protein
MADAFSIALLALTVAAVATVCLLLFEKGAARFAAMPRRASAGRPGAARPASPLHHVDPCSSRLASTKEEIARWPGLLIAGKAAALVKAGPKDAAPMDSARPFNINYENMQKGFHRLGHIKKQAIGFDMGKSKARDMNMYMTTEAYKNVLYDNYKMECEEMFVPGVKPLTSPSGKRSLLGHHRRGESMRNSFQVGGKSNNTTNRFL